MGRTFAVGVLMMLIKPLFVTYLDAVPVPEDLYFGGFPDADDRDSVKFYLRVRRCSEPRVANARIPSESDRKVLSFCVA
jgi:hypothetical protein